MNSESTLPLLVAVVGPTASGKSTLGIWLAQKLRGEVVACDSTQLYRGFDIGTAKPLLAERHGIPHHLLDVLSPTEASTAGSYRRMALDVLSDLRCRERTPIFTVGTGLYLRALLEGLADLPDRSEELRARLRQSARAGSPGHLHRLLRRLDPASAARIAPGDEQKLIRAVEVCLLARKPQTELHEAGRAPLEGWRIVKIGLNPSRDALHDRIHARTAAMLEAGWLQEVKRLTAIGLPDDAKPFDFLGYRELYRVLKGDMGLQDARSAIQLATRRYAKRQLTWFRRDPQIHWFSGFGNDHEVQAACLRLLMTRNRS